VATIRSNGVELYYERLGKGEPVLFVHGLLFSTESWRHQLDTLASEYDVIGVDLRGQGRSETTDDAAGYDLWNQAEDIHGLIDQLGIAPTHYVGLSMGGMIGMRLCLRHAADVRSLVLLDTQAGLELEESVPMYQAFIDVTEAGGLEDVLPGIPPMFFSGAFPQQHPEVIDAWTKRWREANVFGMTRASRGVIYRTDDITGQIAAINVPTLVLHGTEDAAIETERGEAVARAIPGAGFDLIPGAGHMSCVEKAEDVTRRISDFLAQVKTTAGATSVPPH
jgi:pimeloyl-ACP methyl ester carboxylesterase